MNNDSSNAAIVLNPCIHDVRVEVMSGLVITFCSKCGMILDTQVVPMTIL